MGVYQAAKVNPPRVFEFVTKKKQKLDKRIQFHWQTSYKEKNNLLT